MRSEAWTVEQIDLLKKLWAEGETAAAIAARLDGISRSAVLGKVFRLRLRTDKAAAASPTKAKSAGHGRAETALVRRRRGGQNKRRQSTLAAGTRRTTLLELTNNTCRWPHGRPGTSKFFFCGAADADLEHGIPYCARHMRRAYNASASVGEGGPAASTGLRPSSFAPGRFDPRPALVISAQRVRPRQV
jgi:GcrA cell cycle regulator